MIIIIMMYRENINPLTKQPDSVIRENPDGSTSHIPADTGNRDYQEYLKWVAEGSPLPMETKEEVT